MVKNTCCSCREPRFDCQNRGDRSQPPVTSVLRDLTSLLASLGIRHAYGIKQTDRQNVHTYKIKINGLFKKKKKLNDRSGRDCSVGKSAGASRRSGFDA